MTTSAARIQLFVWSLLLAGGAQAAQPTEQDYPPKSYVTIEERIDQARKELDQAARKLAELHAEQWRMETSGARADEPMLGFLFEEVGDADGLMVAGVTPEGGAEQAGFKAGDVLVEVNGARLDRGGETKPLTLLARAMRDVHPGDAVAVKYVRDGETRQADVVTQRRGAYMARVLKQKEPWLDTLQSLSSMKDLQALQGLEELERSAAGDVNEVPAGLRLEDVSGPLADYFQVDGGVLVADVPERVKGLEGGDILLDVGGEAVVSADAALRRLASLEGQVTLRVKRHGRIREVHLDADALNAQQEVQVGRGDRRIRIEKRAEPDSKD